MQNEMQTGKSPSLAARVVETVETAVICALCSSLMTVGYIMLLPFLLLPAAGDGLFLLWMAGLPLVAFVGGAISGAVVGAIRPERSWDGRIYAIGAGGIFLTFLCAGVSAILYSNMVGELLGNSVAVLLAFISCGLTTPLAIAFGVQGLLDMRGKKARLISRLVVLVAVVGLGAAILLFSKHRREEWLRYEAEYIHNINTPSTGGIEYIGYVGAFVFAEEEKEWRSVEGEEAVKRAEELPCDEASIFINIEISSGVNEGSYIADNEGNLYVKRAGEAKGWIERAVLPSSKMLAPPTFLAVSQTSPGEIWTDSYDYDKEQLFRSRDYGESWEEVELPFEKDDFWSRFVNMAIVPGDPETLVLTSGEAIFLSRDKGETWQKEDYPEGLDTFGGTRQILVVPSQPPVVYLLFTLNEIYASEDLCDPEVEKKTWRQVDHPLEYDLEADDSDEEFSRQIQQLEVDAKVPSTIYIANTNEIYRSQDAGNSWEKIK